MNKLITANMYRMKKYHLTRHLLLPVCFIAILCSVFLEETEGLSGVRGSVALERILANLMYFLDLLLLPVLARALRKLAKSYTESYKFPFLAASLAGFRACGLLG